MSSQYDLGGLAERFGAYPVEAYVFVGEGLHHAARRLGKHDEDSDDHHINAQELVLGILDLAAQRFGGLAYAVLQSWSLLRSEDIGQITFHLIDEGLFGKQPGDTIEDFADGPSFADRLYDLTRERMLGVA